MPRSWLWLAAMLCIPQAFAQEQVCPEPVRRALLPDAGTAIAAEACKRAPDAPTQWLATLAYAVDDAPQGERSLTHVVAMVGARGDVIARHDVALEEDAALELAPGGLRIDTGRYHLAPAQRAFGVVLQSSARGPSCPDRRFDDELTLYVRDGRALRPVFATYLEVTSAVRGALCAMVDQDNVSDNATITLAMGKGRSHGYADIMSTATITRWSQRDDRERTRRASQVFRYDGQRYRPGDSAADASLYWEDAGAQP